MTEQQIKDGFEQLAGALAPPVDAPDRGDRRVRVRRRRRRAGVAGAALVAVVATAGTAIALSGGDDAGGDLVATDPAGLPQSTLVLTRADGSTYAFDDVTVTCDEPFQGAATGPGQRIYLSTPRHIEGKRVTEPWLYVEAILDDVAAGKELTFPTDWSSSSDEYPLIVFVADTDGNEAASSAGTEKGTVRVLEASCAPVPVLRLEMDMSLGSEVSQEPLRVAGELR